MEEKGFLGIILILINALVTYQGLKDYSFLDKYSFKVDEILVQKDYKRLITSGFLHGSWTHFGFNMFSLYCFSSGIEAVFGPVNFLLIYFSSLIGGNLFSLYLHRSQPGYSAVGASGAICGIVFASIALFPGMEIALLFLPVYFPSWIFGLLFVLVSIYGIRSQAGNIGHDAHLGGGLVGLLLAIALVPEALITNYLPIVLILVPSTIFMFMIWSHPEMLLVNHVFKKENKFYTFEDRFHANRKVKEQEVNLILEKISKYGFDSLTKLEKDKLDQSSNGF